MLFYCFFENLLINIRTHIYLKKNQDCNQKQVGWNSFLNNPVI